MYKRQIWTGLLFFFQCWILTAQPIHQGTYRKLYEQSPNEKTAISLSKALQSIANWYSEMPQYNSDSSRFYFLAAEKLLIQHHAVDELLEVYRDALSTFSLFTPAEVDSIAAVSYTHLDVYKRQVQRSIPIKSPNPNKKSFSFIFFMAK